MAGYNRVHSLVWPVVFHATGGRQFTVLEPVPADHGLVLRCRVIQADAVEEHEIGPYYSESSAGAVIGRTLRWWIIRTGVGITIARSLNGLGEPDV